MLLCGATDLVSIFISLETLSVASYLLSGARTVYGPADPRGVAAEMLSRFENDDARRMVLEAGEVEFPSKIGDAFS
jgi:hypothetical protein